MKHRVSCVFCRKVVTAQGLNGHMRAAHMRGADQRAAVRKPIVRSDPRYRSMRRAEEIIQGLT